MGRLSNIEAELLELLRCGTIGNLKSKGLVTIVRLPNKERRIFAKNPHFPY